MAKPSKSSSQEFLAKRRKAIAEMANKRRQQQLLRSSGVTVTDSRTKATATTSVSLRSSAAPSQS